MIILISIFLIEYGSIEKYPVFALKYNHKVTPPKHSNLDSFRLWKISQIFYVAQRKKKTFLALFIYLFLNALNTALFMCNFVTCLQFKMITCLSCFSKKPALNFLVLFYFCMRSQQLHHFTFSNTGDQLHQNKKH